MKVRDLWIIGRVTKLETVSMIDQHSPVLFTTVFMIDRDEKVVFISSS